MGIYDRDYYREPRPQGGRYVHGAVAGIRMWSVNTWIIALCVAVFVIDHFHFLPPRPFPTGRYILPANVPIEMVVPGDNFRGMAFVERRHNGRDVPVQGVGQSLHDPHSGALIGWREVLPMRFLESYLHFSTARGFFGIEYWRFIGFQFLHANLSHLLFNMLGLYFFGAMVEAYLGSKRYLAFYLLCGIFGAVMYLVLNLGGFVLSDILKSEIRIPGLLFNDPATPLVGASAGIFGVLMAGAFLAPRELVFIFGLIPIRLRTLAYVLVAIALVSVLTGGHNAGGEAGHLGGAIAGYYFIRRPHHLHGFFDFLGRVDPTSHHYRGARSRRRYPQRSAGFEAEIDRILDKIHQQGRDSLTESERRTLREATRES